MFYITAMLVVILYLILDIQKATKKERKEVNTIILFAFLVEILTYFVK